ncbi:ankyrin repeat domain-containing protein [Flexithrix dorotheae]|uniref:ankyrin repeat domain-containing protein n=1 Tax=Flexithrix dorotheae TaxID=70993 RepID=UPI00036435E2|nr:ankyrin repeat domain-containing protein [Flexithrix dorotheae]
MEDLLEMVRDGDTKKLRVILEKNPALADTKVDQGISLLQYAAYCRGNSTIQLIREFKKELNVFEAVSLGEIEIAGKLIDADKSLINSYSGDGFTPLGLAAFFGFFDLVKLLLAKGADPNLASNNQFKVAPIHSACAISSYEIAKLLIENGANVNARQMQGVTPLHSAAHNGEAEIVKLLLENGAKVNAKLETGQTALAMAIDKNFGAITDLLREKGGE